MTSSDAAPRLLPLIRQLQTDRAALLAAFERVPALRRAERPAPDRWSAAEVADHVAIVESRLAAALHKALPELPAAGPDAGITSFDPVRVLDRSTRFSAPEFVHPKGHVDPALAIAALAQAWSDVDDVIAAAERRDLAAWQRPHPALGLLDGYQWLASLGGHARRHAAQIDEIADVLGV